MKIRILIFISAFLLLLVFGFLTHETKTEYSFYTQVKIQNKQINLSKLKVGEIYRDSILVQKTGSNPLLISSIKFPSKKDYLIIDNKPQLYSSKKIISIPFIIQPTQTEKIKDTLFIYGNFPEEKLEVVITGEVIE